jgi:hypothetical protein
MEEMSLAKAINDEDNEMPAVLSTTKPAEGSDEMIKIIKEEDSCCDKIKATTMVEIAKTSLEEAQLDEKPYKYLILPQMIAFLWKLKLKHANKKKSKITWDLSYPQTWHLQF